MCIGFLNRLNLCPKGNNYRRVRIISLYVGYCFNVYNYNVSFEGTAYKQGVLVYIWPLDPEKTSTFQNKCYVIFLQCPLHINTKASVRMSSCVS